MQYFPLLYKYQDCSVNIYICREIYLPFIKKETLFPLNMVVIKSKLRKIMYLIITVFLFLAVVSNIFPSCQAGGACKQAPVSYLLHKIFFSQFHFNAEQEPILFDFCCVVLHTVQAPKVRNYVLHHRRRLNIGAFLCKIVAPVTKKIAQAYA
jgi:hypothetical protein